MNEIQTTKLERDIMIHALGIGGGKESYRNHFCTGPGSKDFDLCQGMVEKGLMTVRKHPFCDDFLFYVTKEGMEEVGMKGTGDG